MDDSGELNSICKSYLNRIDAQKQLARIYIVLSQILGTLDALKGYNLRTIEDAILEFQDKSVCSNCNMNTSIDELSICIDENCCDYSYCKKCVKKHKKNSIMFGNIVDKYMDIMTVQNNDGKYWVEEGVLL